MRSQILFASYYHSFKRKLLI